MSCGQACMLHDQLPVPIPPRQSNNSFLLLGVGRGGGGEVICVKGQLSGLSSLLPRALGNSGLSQKPFSPGTRSAGASMNALHPCVEMFTAICSTSF